MTERGRKVELRSAVMRKNDRIAEENGRAFGDAGLLCLNLMSSPGAGKTTLLERLAERLGDSLAVIEGDVQTRRDAERVEAAGSFAHQIETGGSCHLDAEAVSRALAEMRPFREAWRYLVIENVGNLICPSGFYLGEHLTAGMLSVPEGDDKVLKYPGLFSKVDLMLINKTDLEGNLPFDARRAEEECRSLNPDVTVLGVSALKGAGVDELTALMEEERRKRFG
jgi:hydrogenase nickel incorporation protein HypB